MIEVTNIKIDTKVLDAMIKNLKINADEAVHTIAYDVEAEAKQLAPVDTGALRNSIHNARIGDKTYWVQDGVNYGIYQELGSYKMAAHPFMVPAVEKIGRKLADYYKRLFP